jgi:hypothetical protein
VALELLQVSLNHLLGSTLGTKTASESRYGSASEEQIYAAAKRMGKNRNRAATNPREPRPTPDLDQASDGAQAGTRRRRKGGRSESIRTWHRRWEEMLVGVSGAQLAAAHQPTAQSRHFPRTKRCALLPSSDGPGWAFVARLFVGSMGWLGLLHGRRWA